MREDERTKQEKTEIEDEEEDDVNEEKWEREKSWPFLCFCLFISAFDSSQPRDVDKMSDLLPFIFCLYLSIISFFAFFPLRFLYLPFPLYLFFSSFYSMLLYSIILSLYIYIFLHVCFT